MAFDNEYIADDQQPDFIALADEDGNEDTFVIIGCVCHQETYYVLTLSVNEENDPDTEEVVYVFAVRHDEEGEYFEYISDEDVLTAVYERYDTMYQQIVDGYGEAPDGAAD